MGSSMNNTRKKERSMKKPQKKNRALIMERDLRKHALLGARAPGEENRFPLWGKAPRLKLAQGIAKTPQGFKGTLTPLKGEMRGRENGKDILPFGTREPAPGKTRKSPPYLEERGEIAEKNGRL